MSDKYNINSTPSFSNKQKKAIAEMKEKNLNVMPIPDGCGFVIVRKGTSEAKERTDKKLCPFSTEIEGEEYLVCRA